MDEVSIVFGNAGSWLADFGEMSLFVILNEILNGRKKVILMRNKDKLALGKVLLYASVVCSIMALIGSMGTDLWLASTQWLLVGLTLAVWSVFVLIEAQFKIGKK